MSRTRKPLVKNRKTLGQLILFEGLQRKGLSPSDIDAVLEIHDNYLILFEVKKDGVDIPRGQRVLLETLVDVWDETGRMGLVVKANHRVKNNADILLKDCEVEEVYYKGSWKVIEKTILVGKFLDDFYKKQKIKL